MMRSKLTSFVIAGAIGFVVDAGILQLLSRVLGVEVHLARLLSFLCSSATTWRINRRYTFDGRGAGGPQFTEWLRYLWSSAAGGLVNYGTFSAWIAMAGSGGLHPIIGVAVGSIAGMSVNYALYSHYVFRRRANP
jgi:putative flippase GtrA